MKKPALFILFVFFLVAFSFLIVFVSLYRFPVYATGEPPGESCPPNCNPPSTEPSSPSYASVGAQFMNFKK
jgi:hypothetical protein